MSDPLFWDQTIHWPDAETAASTPNAEFSGGEEEELEREALAREARQEALLDAGPILAEYRRAKGE